MPPSNEQPDREREQPPESREESETVRILGRTEAQDAETIRRRLLERSAAEAAGDFSEQIAECTRQLEASRAAYVQQYAAVVEARKNALPPEEIEQRKFVQQQGHDIYVAAKKRYAEVLVEAQKVQLTNSGFSEIDRKARLNAYIQAEIFTLLVVNEEVVLQEQKTAVHPPETKGVLMRMYERWDGLSGMNKGLIMTALATGTAFMSTGFAHGFAAIELTAVALLFSKSFLVGMAQEYVAGLTALGVNTLLTKKIEQSFTENVEKERQDTRVEALEQTSERYKALLEKKSLQGSQALVVSALAMLATGRAFSVGMNFLSGTNALKGIADAMTTSFESGPNIAGNLSDSDALGKPVKGLTKGILKKLAQYWKQD